MAHGDSHSPLPAPPGSWIMSQRWEHVLFAHWPVAPAALRALLPPGVALDTHEGRAFLGVVPFRMRGVRVAGLPPVPGLSAFPELNVRTYVTVGEQRGVHFFSLDAENAVAVAVARRWFGLPYHRARFTLRIEDGEHGARVTYACRRTHRGSPPAELSAVYAPVGPARAARPGTLEHFLTERYALFVTRRDGSVWRGDVRHAPWPLQDARIEGWSETVTAPLGLTLEGEPLLHYARDVTTRIWRPRTVYRPVAAPRV